jgi:hypothetical protein
MSALMDLPNKMWMPLDILPDQKERCADVMLCKYIQYLRRVAWVRTVVEGQRDLAAGGVPIK